MKLLICSLLVLGTSFVAEAKLNQRVEIQPGGWVRIDPQVATDVYCIGSANEVTKICRCDFDTENKFRAELVLVSSSQADKVTALTPYYYATYESCVRELATFAVCSKKD